MCDEEVKDILVIKEIFKFINKKQLFCTVVIERDYSIIVYDKIRILEITEHGCKFRSFINKATLVDTFNFDTVKELRLETEIEKVYNKGDETDSRWYLLDIEEDKEIEKS